YGFADSDSGKLCGPALEGGSVLPSAKIRETPAERRQATELTLTCAGIPCANPLARCPYICLDSTPGNGKKQAKEGNGVPGGI
ncbi:hypothetical protein MYX77_12720, partial [Acidobacteriia bacterium AH_259_A11_L15]|nr:hypothetical protein [Acidobacteriia bacterium AH_259_A11_L15]